MNRRPGWTVRSPHRRHASSALTLVEVLIVVVVLAIMATAAVPMLARAEGTRLQAAASLLLADLQFAQMQSLSHPDALCGVRFDTSAESYALVNDGGGPFDCAAATPIIDAVRQEDYVTVFGAGRAGALAGVTIDAVDLDGDDCLVFGPLGELDQTVSAVITLRMGGDNLTVSIDPVSGEATVGP